MSINYFKENLKKFDHDNLISFLFDIVVRGGIENVEDFDKEKQYVENDKVYIKDSKGTHHIYKCRVEKAEKGLIKPDEWIDLLQSFRKPIVNEETIVSSLDIREEVLISTVDNQKEFKLNTVGVEEGMYTVVVFHPTLGRLSRQDFELAGSHIILNEDCVVPVADSRLIVDLYQNI